MATLQVTRGPDAGRTFDLQDGENVIGRQSDTLPLTDGTMSRKHSRVSKTEDTWVIEDLGSANGTFLNEVRLAKPCTLTSGDQIRCGSSLLVFDEGGMPATVDVDEDGRLVDAAIVATVPSNEDSIIIPTPEAGAQAIDSLRILYNFIEEIGKIFDVEALLQQTLDKVVEIFSADRGYVLLLNEAGRLALRTSRIAKGTKKKIPISRTIVNEVTANRVGVLSSNAMTDKRFASGKSVQNLGIRSTICVPINGREGILGVIHLDCSVSERTYSTEDLRLLTAIGFQTGLAIENVRLYEAAVQTERLAAVGETTAYLSHHIKNIIQALSAGTQVVEMGLRENKLEKAQTAWPIVQRNLDRINQVILNMLAFSKKREPLLENINLNSVLQECIALASGWVDQRGIVLMSDLDTLPDIPADPAGLHQAFLNLINNAVDAVADGTGMITISTRFDIESGKVIAKVIDNGAGIPASQVRDVFTPFYSAKGQRGTGLGLAVASKVFTEHHGTITVDSKVNEGTTFTVTLPTQPHEDESEKTHSTPAPEIEM